MSLYKFLFSTCVAYFGYDPIHSMSTVPCGNQPSTAWGLWILLLVKDPHGNGAQGSSHVLGEETLKPRELDWRKATARAEGSYGP